MSAKITDLTTIVGAGVASTDVLVIVDVSDATMAASGTDKKVSVDDLRIGMGALNQADANGLYSVLAHTHAASALTGTTLAAGIVTSSLTAVGTITSGVWTGTAIAIANGGTGATTAANAINALLPTQAGNNGKYLTTDGTAASWATVSASDATKLPLAGGTMTGNLILTGADIRLDNSKALYAKDNGGTYQRVFFVDAGNNYGARNEGDSGSAYYGLSNASNVTGVTYFQIAGNNIAAFLTNGALAFGGSFDVALYRNAAGVLEINNGTAGTYRDLTLRTLTSTAGTITANTPALSATQTWNAAGVAFKGIFLNVTNTASSASAYLFELQVGGATKVYADVNGNLQVSNQFSAGAGGFTDQSGYTLSANVAGLVLGNTRFLKWSSTAIYNGTVDLGLYRNAAGVLEVNNGTAGTFRDLTLRNLTASGTITGNVTGTSSLDLPLAGGTMTGQITSTLGTITTDIRALSATATWNASGTTFKGIFLDVTNTASAAASMLVDLQVAGASKFSVTTAGVVAAASSITCVGGNHTSEIVALNGQGVFVGATTNSIIYFRINGGTNLGNFSKEGNFYIGSGFTAAGAKLDVSGTIRTSGANAQALDIKYLTELTTIAAAATTDTTIQMPAGAIILGVSSRVTTAIPTATSFDVGDSGLATRFNTAVVGVAAASTDAGTKAGAYYNAGALAIRLTMNGGVPAANTGRVRVTIHYLLTTPPTS